MSRTIMISFRAEPETARALTWLVNKHNYEKNESLSKTEALERLIMKAVKSPELLEVENGNNGKHD